jgi:Tol biopolymer transport system component
MNMHGITHKQAQRYLRGNLDGLLTEAQRLDLETHLDSCASCRGDSEAFAALTSRLQTQFHSRWDTQDGPSRNALTNIQSQSRRIHMQKRIDFAFNILGGIVTLLVLFFVVTSVISQFQKKSVAAYETQTNVLAAISQTGGLLAFTSAQDGNLEIYTASSDGSELTNITNNPGRDMDPVWSPDGKRIAFVSDDRSGSGSLQIYSMNPDGTDLIRLTNIPDTEWWAGMDWSPDGKYLVAQHFPIESQQTTPGNGPTSIYLINADGSGTTPLTENESGGDHSPKWSPKGDLIAFLHTESDLTQVYTIHPDGNGLFKLSDSERNDSVFNWSSDGSQIMYFSSPINCFPPDTCPRNEIWSVRADGAERVMLLVLPDSITPDAALDQVDWAPDRVAWSPDGTRLISVTWDSPPGSPGNSYLSILSPFDNSDPVHKKLAGHIAEISWSPDGLSFTFGSDASGNWDIYTLSVIDVIQNPSAEPIQITNSLSADMSPAWQPIMLEDLTETQSTPEPEKTSSYDGLIVFTRVEGDNTDIYTIRPDGTDLKRLTNHPAFDGEPLWSSDGTRIVFESGRDHNIDIYTMNPDGSNLQQLTTNPGFDGFANWSPDGQKIVYISSTIGDPNISSRLFVMNADGTNKVALTDLESYIFLGWSPNGQKIVYLRQDTKTNNPQDDEIHVVDIDGTNDHQWRAIIDEIKWIDAEHFVGHGWSGASEPPSWRVYKFDANGGDPVEIAITPSRVVALFDQTYLVEDVRTFAWYSIDGNTTPLNRQDFSAHCNKNSDRFLQDTGHTISPDEMRAFVTIYCSEGTTWFYLENSDGSQFVQLTDFSIINPEQTIGSATWSPDGNYVTVTIASRNGDTADIYLFDIQKMLSDPSTDPIPLTTDGAIKYVANWRPNP